MDIDIKKLFNYLLNFVQKIVTFIKELDERFDLGLAKEEEGAEEE